jgi:hypothetical protein
MKPRLRGLHAALLAALLAFTQLFAGAIAASPTYAGLVIRHGDGRITYAYIPLENEITGIELLRQSGVSMVTVGFGGLGEGVCSIDGTGCGVGECRKRLCQEGGADAPYWRYFRLSKTGVWKPMLLGASGSIVMPGDLDGWSWTADEPNLPAVSIAEIPRLAHADPAESNEAAISTYLPDGNLDSGSRNGQSTAVYLALGGMFGALLLGLVYTGRRRRSVANSP